MGQNLIRMGNYNAGILFFEKAIEIKPNEAAIAFVYRGAAKGDIGDTEGALTDYEKAIEHDPNYSKAYTNRGNVRSDQGDIEGAIADYDESIQLDSNYKEAIEDREIAICRWEKKK